MPSLLHLPSREEAKDAAQDTLTALLLMDRADFDLVNAKSYLFGILRNKISDRLRQKYRARKQLQLCLHQNWFEQERAP